MDSGRREAPGWKCWRPVVAGWGCAERDDGRGHGAGDAQRYGRGATAICSFVCVLCRRAPPFSGAWADGDLLILCVLCRRSPPFRGAEADGDLHICVLSCPSTLPTVRPIVYQHPPHPTPRFTPHTELTTKMVEAAKAKGAEVRSIDALLTTTYLYGHDSESSASSK